MAHRRQIEVGSSSSHFYAVSACRQKGQVERQIQKNRQCLKLLAVFLWPDNLFRLFGDQGQNVVAGNQYVFLIGYLNIPHHHALRMAIW